MATADVNLVKMIGTVSRDPRVFDSDPDRMPFMTLNVEVREEGIVTAEQRVGHHTLKGFGKDLVKLAHKLNIGARIKTYGRLANRSYGEGENQRWITEVIIDPANFTILKPVTEKPDPMADYNMDAAQKGIQAARLEAEVYADRRSEELALAAEAEQERRNTPGVGLKPQTEPTFDSDDIPF